MDPLSCSAALRKAPASSAPGQLCLMPDPSVRNDLVDVRALRAPIQHFAGSRSIRYERCRIPGPPRRKLLADSAARDPLHTVPDLEYARAPAGPEIDCRGGSAPGQILERLQMRAGQVCDMDIVPDRRPVAGVVVITKDTQALIRRACASQGKWNVMRFSSGTRLLLSSSRNRSYAPDTERSGYLPGLPAGVPAGCRHLRQVLRSGQACQIRYRLGGPQRNRASACFRATCKQSARRSSPKARSKARPGTAATRL